MGNGTLNKELRYLAARLNKMYEEDKYLIPRQSSVFDVLKMIKPDDLKVIILSSNSPNAYSIIRPYIPIGVMDEFTDIHTIELQNALMREYKVDLPKKRNYFKDLYIDRTLQTWVRQGVMTLNSSMTKSQLGAKDHYSLWQPFLKQLLYDVSLEYPGNFYIFVGERAVEFSKYVNNRYSKVFKYRTFNDINCFKYINDELLKQGRNEIEWLIEK